MLIQSLPNKASSLIKKNLACIASPAQTVIPEFGERKKKARAKMTFRISLILTWSGT